MYNSHFEEQQAQHATSPAGHTAARHLRAAPAKKDHSHDHHRDSHNYDDGLVHDHSWASSSGR